MTSTSPLERDGGIELQQARYTKFKWRMLFVVMICYASYYTGRQNFGFAARHMGSDLHLSATEIGSISAGLLVAYAAGGMLSGYLGDHVSPRLVVTVGAVLSFTLNWITSFGSNYWQIFLPWVLNGLVQAMGWSPCTKIMANWWPHSQRGLSFGLLLFGMNCATVATYAVCLLSLTAGGWREVFRLPVLAMIPAVLLFFLLVKDQPSDAGLPNIRASGRDSVPLSIAQTYLPLLRSPRFLLICASIGCESMARYGLLVWIPIHMLGSDWRVDSLGRWITLLLPLGMALGAACTGVVSDRVFHGRWHIPIMLLMGAAALISVALGVTAGTNLATAGCLLVAAGFCVYGPQTAFWSLAHQIGGPARGSSATGLMDASAYIFAAAGEMLIGRIVDFTHTTASLFPVIAITCTLSSLFMLPLLGNRKAAQ